MAALSSGGPDSAATTETIAVIERHHGQQRAVVRTFRRIGSFIRAAQYVLILIVAFTLTWLPGLLSLLFDAISDYLGGHHYETECGGDVDDSLGEFTQLELSLVQLMMIRAMHAENGTAFAMSSQSKCDLILPPTAFCVLSHRALHSYRKNIIQNIVVLVGTVHAVLNPVIYAFCYPHFRDQARSAFGWHHQANQSHLNQSHRRRRSEDSRVFHSEQHRKRRSSRVLEED